MAFALYTDIAQMSQWATQYLETRAEEAAEAKALAAREPGAQEA